jgi:hypothetical protein
MKPNHPALQIDVSSAILQWILWNLISLAVALHVLLVYLTLPRIWSTRRGRNRFFWTLGILFVPYLGAALARRSVALHSPPKRGDD